MKQLILVRHAKSSWKDPTLLDFERPLNKRGKQDAPMMAARLAQRGVAPELILCSPATRTLLTAQVMAAHLNYPQTDIQTDPALYEASLPTLIQLLQRQPDHLNRLMLVGHAPGIAELARYLCGEPSGKFPTCAVLHAQLPVTHWSMLQQGCGQCIGFDYPKKSLPPQGA